MNRSHTIPLQRSLLWRWADEVLEFLVCSWQRRRAARALDQRVDAMADLSAAVLRDIGGPQELLDRSAARRLAHEQCLGHMRMLAGYHGVDSRYW